MNSNFPFFFVYSQDKTKKPKTMNTKARFTTAKERLTTGKHQGRHIDEDFEHDCLDGESQDMENYDTFDDSNLRKND